MNNLHAVLLGVIEGLTEFLPISSTAHLILTNYFLGYNLSSDLIQVFQISIQLGAVLAVVFYYFKDLIKLETIKLLIIGVTPTIILGLIFSDYIKILLATPEIIAYTLMLGGAIMICVELWYKKQNNLKKEISNRNSFLFGIIQSLAMIPGVSRSGAIIVSGLIMKYEREVIAKYAFLLAVPTMFAATTYSIYKNREVVMSSQDNIFNIFIGFVFAFLTALIVLKLLIPFVKKYSFMPFGIYRIILGISLLFLINN